MKKETERKGPIMCRRDELWKSELDKRLKTDNDITLMALGDVKNELLIHLNSQNGNKIHEKTRKRNGAKSNSEK